MKAQRRPSATGRRDHVILAVLYRNIGRHYGLATGIHAEVNVTARRGLGFRHSANSR